MLGEFAASFEWQMFYYGLTAMGFPLNLAIDLIFLLIIHPVVFGITYLMESRYRDFIEDMTVSYAELATCALIALFIFLLSDLSYASPDTPFSSDPVADTFAMRTLADLAGVALMYGLYIIVLIIAITS